MLTEQRDRRYAALGDLRPPDLGFALPLVADLQIGCGLKGAIEACCRYAHHPTCPSAIVRSVLGVRFFARSGDQGVATEQQLPPYVHPGDLLGDIGQLMAVVRQQHATIAASGDAWRDRLGEDVTIPLIEVQVWCLTRAESEALDALWAPIEAEHEDQLPCAYLDLDEAEDVDRVYGAPAFRPVERYRPGELVLPGEVGRDGRYRYLTQGVIDPPDAVDRVTIKEAAVHVILEDGTETDVLVTARYDGPDQEPCGMTFTTLSERTRS